MPVKLKDYDRNQKKRKENIRQSGLLLVGLDVRKAQHDTRIGTLDSIKRRIGFANTRDGFKRFENIHMVKFGRVILE